MTRVGCISVLTVGRRSWLVLLAVLLLGGCTDAERTSPAAPASPAGVERYGAPVVPNPVDVTSLMGAPCTTTLNRADLRSLNISTVGDARSNLGASVCTWRSDEDDRLSISVDAERDLLVDSYRARLTPIFQPTEINGFPAVRQRTSNEVNTCTVTAGVGSRQALEADWTGHRAPSSEEDPCAKAEEAIALVVRKLPPQR